MINFGPFKSLSTKEFQEKQAEGFTVIDIRREQEWEEYGIIEHSHKVTFFDELGQFDLEQFLELFTKVVTQKDQPFILVCAHAQRTKIVAEIMGSKLGYTNVYELDGGINWGWIDKGFKTIRS
jgi:rhodanese-related sulfurtransferase